MYSDKKILGLIPARGGSKGIPGKNLADLGGQPLLSWVAREAQKCSELDELILSTDSLEIQRVGRDLNLEVPFLRPKELSADKSTSYGLIEHALQWFENHRNLTFDYVCLAQPTAPFTLAADYSKAIKKAVDENADTIISVAKCGQKHPALMYTLDENGKAEWFLKSDEAGQMPRRQDLPPVYGRTGSVYIFKCETLLKTKTLYGGTIFSVEIPEERALDIDSPFDLKLANGLVKTD